MNLQAETKLVSIHRVIISCILGKAISMSLGKNHLHSKFSTGPLQFFLTQLQKDNVFKGLKKS